MHPYKDLLPDSFWRTAVADINPLEIEGLWKPKLSLTPDDAVVTAGSCFAQHIGKALVKNGYSWLDAEPAPAQASAELRRKFNYGIFSFRTGNIYTTSLLLQWCEWALSGQQVPDEVWTNKEGRFIDPFRPNIEPNGFKSIEELQASRKGTLNAILHAVKTAKVFVFTLGLTEAWRNKKHGYLYAMCPGTLYGTFNEKDHEFVNFRYPDVRQSMVAAIRLMRKINPELKFLLTVSPVPLTATASSQHVLTATTHSKSILRAVAGDIAYIRDDTDYFPSYEIITGFPFRGMFFEPNMRSVSHKGVEFVMNSFFACLNADGTTSQQGSTRNNTTQPVQQQKSNDDVVCEEELLNAFA